MLKKLLSVTPIQTTFMRFRQPKKMTYPNIQRFEGAPYYPNEHMEQHEEPITEPAKLFRVQRIKPAKGRPYWERRILSDLGIGQTLGQVAIVKNIPEMNRMLYRVKHLVKVDPITFPYGEPTQEDLAHTYLTPTGECIVTKQIAIDPERIKAADKFITDPERLDKDTLARDALKKWINPMQ